MAYNVSYTTLPTFTTNSIGYVDTGVSYFTGSGWFAPDQLTLSQGIYIITANVSYSNSPNSFAYILAKNVDNSSDLSNNSIWFGSSVSSYGTMSNYGTYQPDIPSPSGFSGYNSYYPVAGQQMRNGPAGACSSLSLSATIKSNKSFLVSVLANSQTSGVNCATIKVVKIS